MVKRTQSQSPSKKKQKTTHSSETGQSSLTTFFSSPNTAQTTPRPRPSSSRNIQAQAAPPASQIIDVDAWHANQETSHSSEPMNTSLDIPVPSTSPTEVTKRSGSQWNLASSSLSESSFPVLTADPAVFDPSALSAAQVEGGSEIGYAFLTHALLSLSNTRSRIDIISILTNTFHVIFLLHPPSLLPAVYLLTNSLGPSYEGVELGLGGSTLGAAIQSVSSMSPSAIKKLYQTHGDLGDVAMAAKSNVRTLCPLPPLTITAVYASSIQISQTKGTGAGKQKQKIVEKLLLAARGEEARYLVRTLAQNLRVGAVRTSILTALSRAAALLTNVSAPHIVKDNSVYHASETLLTSVKRDTHPKKNGVAGESVEVLNSLYRQAETCVKGVYAKHPNFEHIVRALLQSGLDDLQTLVPMTVGVPIMPCLGSPTRSLDEIYDRLGNLDWAAEWKYDGQRAQIHVQRDGEMTHCRIFSRHLEDMTSKYPDVVALMDEILSANASMKSFVLDSEIVAVDSYGSLRPFQELSNRPRKDVQLGDVTIPVAVYVFDLMYLDNVALIDMSFRERRQRLHENLRVVSRDGPSLQARFCYARSCEASCGRPLIESFFREAVANQCEGLMVKLLDGGEQHEAPSNSRKLQLPATYEPDKRTAAWLKLKKDYLDSAEGLDMVPVAAWHGQGRKSIWWSPILLAIRDSSTGRLTALCKCMSGFSDSFYKDLIDRYPPGTSESTSTRPLWEVDFGGWAGQPDVYFKPSEVWEIRGAELTLSPVSIAAKGLASSDRGLSLRFPRFMRTRDDKAIEQASDEQYLTAMWRSQQKHQPGNDEGELIDVDDVLSSSMEEEEEEEY